MKKGNYPSEAALLNGIIFTIMNADEIYSASGQCLVIMLPDLPDSDDLVIFLVLERIPANGDRGFVPLDIVKKSGIQVQMT